MRLQSKRSRVKSVIGLALTLLLAGGVSAQAKETVTFWHAMGGAHGTVLDNLVGEFNKQNPDIEVKAFYQGHYGVLKQKLLGAVAAKNPPTVSQVYSDWTAQLIEGQAIVPVGKFVSDQSVGLNADQLNDIFSGFRQANTWSGTLYTMPFNKSVYVLYYNNDLLQKAGVGVPRTWDELRTAARKVTEVTGVKGFVIKPDVDYFGVFLRSAGGEWIDANGQAAFNNEAGRASLTFLADMIRDKSAYLFDGYLEEEMNKGKVAMFIATSSTIPWVQGTFNWGTAAIPAGKAQRTVSQGTDIAIFSQASGAEQAAAWRFVKWLTSTEISARWAAATGYVPVRRSSLGIKAMVDYLNAAPSRHRAPVDQLNNITFDPGVAAWGDIRTFVTEAVGQVLLANADPGRALDAAAAKANAALKR